MLKGTHLYSCKTFEQQLKNPNCIKESSWRCAVIVFYFLDITVQEQTAGALGKLNALHHNKQFITDHMELHMNDFVLVFEIDQGFSYAVSQLCLDSQCELCVSEALHFMHDEFMILYIRHNKTSRENASKID